MHTTVLLGMMALAVNAMETGHARRMPAADMPMITADPMDFLDQVEELRRRELHPRQASSSMLNDLTVTVAADATCGYLSAEIGVPITCTNKGTCAWAQLFPGQGVIRCGTDIKVTCYESTVAVNSSLCNDVCQSDTMNLLWHDVQSAEYTYWGQDSPDFTTLVLDVDTGATKTMRVDKKDDETSKESDETSTTTDVAASATSSSTDTEDKKSSVPLGAIIGGAVGGVALIGAIMLGIFFMLRRKKNETAPAPTDGPINPPTMSFAPQNANAMMLDSKPTNMSPGYKMVEQLFLDLSPDRVSLHDGIHAVKPWATKYIDAIQDERYWDAIWARYHLSGQVKDGKIEGLTVVESTTEDAMGYKKYAPEQYAEAVSFYKRNNSSSDGRTDVIEIIMRVNIEDLTGKHIPEGV
ncbi:unnamed protein product [Fusarium equiseti]|uniref:Mid2 domain-containing protein n=1 Tax=Fusarium equiseti TaxID=61235 RepID=A0A8J2NGR6_FUSEQ|nr:unnamed protein product [Fusarium equiseti]